jgi:hypothetical protein
MFCSKASAKAHLGFIVCFNRNLHRLLIVYFAGVVADWSHPHYYNSPLCLLLSTAEKLQIANAPGAALGPHATLCITNPLMFLFALFLFFNKIKARKITPKSAKTTATYAVESRLLMGSQMGLWKENQKERQMALRVEQQTEHQKERQMALRMRMEQQTEHQKERQMALRMRMEQQTEHQMGLLMEHKHCHQ